MIPKIDVDFGCTNVDIAITTLTKKIQTRLIKKLEVGVFLTFSKLWRNLNSNQTNPD